MESFRQRELEERDPGAPQADGSLLLGPGSKQNLSWLNNPTQTEATAVTAEENPNRQLFLTLFYGLTPSVPTSDVTPSDFR